MPSPPVSRLTAHTASHVSLTEREISVAWSQSLESKENSMFWLNFHRAVALERWKGPKESNNLQLEQSLEEVSKVKFKTLISCCCFRCLECRWRMEIVIEQSRDSRHSYYFYLRILYCVYPLFVPGRIRFSKISRVVQKWWNKALYIMSRGLFTFSLIHLRFLLLVKTQTQKS